MPPFEAENCQCVDVVLSTLLIGGVQLFRLFSFRVVTDALTLA